MLDGPVIPVSAVDEQLARVSAELARVSQMAKEITQRLKELQLERDLLTRLREAAVVPTAKGSGTPPRAAANGSGPLRLPTAQAIYHVVGTEPGLRAGEVVMRAEQILDSDSGDKRRLLYSAISTMKRKGRFEVDANGGLRLKGTGQEQMPLAG